MKDAVPAQAGTQVQPALSKHQQKMRFCACCQNADNNKKRRPRLRGNDVLVLLKSDQ